jgi:hypothetical protein
MVFASDVLHQESPESCLETLRKLHDALRPGGMLVVQGMYLNAEKTGPRWPTLHSLTMLLISGKGRAYSVEEMSTMATKAGFQACRHERMTLLNVNSLVIAERGQH